MARYGKPIHVRTTEEERAKIEQRAKRAGLKFSEYVRRAALGELETSPVDHDRPDPATSPARAPGSDSSQGSTGEETSPGPGIGSPPSPAPGGTTSDSAPSDAAPKPEPVPDIPPEVPVEPIVGGVEAEIREAKLRDEPAHAHFLERRTRELVGQGKTTRLARSLAEAEWRARGTDDGPAAA